MNIVPLFFSNTNKPLLINSVDHAEDKEWSNIQFFEDVTSISIALINASISKRDKVLILSRNRVETYVSSLAAINIGAIVIPLSSTTNKNILLGIILNHKPSVCFFEDDLNYEIKSVLDKSCRLFVQINSEKTFSNITLYSELLNSGSDFYFGQFNSNHPALIIHTSGSQGKPKEIHLSHQNLFNYFHYHDLVHRQFSHNFKASTTQQPLISVFQPNHLAAYSITLQAFLMNRPTFLMQTFEARNYLQILSSSQCSVGILVPSMLSALLKKVDLIQTLDFSSLKYFISVGEPTPPALIEKIKQAFNVLVYSGYGLTECLPGIAHLQSDLLSGNIKAGSCGKLLFSEVKLMKNSNEGNNGELWIRNPTVHRCYSNEDINNIKFTVDGWFKTGDLFEVDIFGNYFHKGRVDDMFVSNGKNIYPVEIENILNSHNDIERTVAVPIVNTEGNTVPAVLILSNSEITIDEIISFYIKGDGLIHTIPRYMLLTDTLPEIGPNKINRIEVVKTLQKEYLLEVKRKNEVKCF